MPKPRKTPKLAGFPEFPVSANPLGATLVLILKSSTMKTYSAKAETAQHDWFVVDGTNAILGRLASEIAHRLRGKHKPEFTPTWTPVTSSWW